MGKLHEALADYTKVIEINSKSCAECLKAHYYRGATLYQMGQYRMAMKDFDTSLRVMPVYRKVYLFRGRHTRNWVSSEEPLRI